jgi:hypothetical protein
LISVNFGLVCPKSPVYQFFEYSPQINERTNPYSVGSKANGTGEFPRVFRRERFP